VAESRGIVVAFQKLSGPFGHATDGGKAVAIDNTYPTGQQAKTLAHELAHCAIHFGKTERATRLTRDIAELEAESIAYVVCKHFGLDAEVRSSRYIALWNGDSKALRDSLDRIATTARELIDDCQSAANSAVKAVAA
jgi:antirestriction protein ArdC